MHEERCLFSRAASLHGDPDKSRAKRFKPLLKPHCVSVPLQIQTQLTRGISGTPRFSVGKIEINLHRHQRLILFETEVLALHIR